MRSLIFATGSVLLIFLLFGCSKGPTSLSGAPIEKGSAKIKLVADSGSAFGSIAHCATAMVTGSGMDTLKCPLSITSNSVSGTIANIVAGSNRLFQVFVEDTGGHVCYYGKAYADVVANGTVNVPMTLFRWAMGNAVINGSIVDTLGQTIYPIDTMPPYRCFVLDSVCYPGAGGARCVVRMVCHGDTILDTVFHPGDSSGCTIIDTATYADRSGTLRYVQRICNGHPYVDTLFYDSTPIDVKLIMPDLSSSVYYYQGDTVQAGVVIFNQKITCVRNINFYCDTTFIGTSSVSPYQITSVLNFQTPGMHQLFAVVVDCNGKAWNSNLQSIKVKARTSRFSSDVSD